MGRDSELLCWLYSERTPAPLVALLASLLALLDPTNVQDSQCTSSALFVRADNHVALLFINKVGGSRHGLFIRLSGYPACLWNQGVRIIKVLLN